MATSSGFALISIAELIVIALTASVALDRPPASAQEAKAYRAADVPAAFKPAVERARKAFTEFQQRMDTRLNDEVSRGGVIGALGVYRDEASSITATLGRTYSGRFGRTSDRLRDPRNAAPSWATDIVKSTGTRLTRDATTWVVPIGTNVGVLAPLDTRDTCVLCHGPAMAVPPDVAAKIRVTYPGDRATGYEVGQLRGWIWAELPR
jgi:hypothetical protein